MWYKKKKYKECTSLINEGQHSNSRGAKLSQLYIPFTVKFQRLILWVVSCGFSICPYITFLTNKLKKTKENTILQNTQMYNTNHNEARSQNMIRDEAAINVQERKANAVDSSNMPQGNPGTLLQKFTSFSNNTTTPAAEHAAANDRIAVTCKHNTLIRNSYTRNFSSLIDSMLQWLYGRIGDTNYPSTTCKQYHYHACWGAEQISIFQCFID